MQLDYIISNTEELANVEQRPTMEGRTMSLTIAPKPQVLQRLAAEKAARERDGEHSQPSNPRPDDELDDENEPDDDEPTTTTTTTRASPTRPESP